MDRHRQGAHLARFRVCGEWFSIKLVEYVVAWSSTGHVERYFTQRIAAVDEEHRLRGKRRANAA